MAIKTILNTDQLWQAPWMGKLSARINEHPRLVRFLGYWILIFTLAGRDIRVRYARSILGIFYSFIDPLFYLGIFTLLRSFLGISSGNVPYVIFAYSALVPWTLFLNIVNGTAPSIISNASILKKTPIPRELFPVINTLVALFDFCMSLTVMFLLMLLYRVPFTVHLLWLPLLLLLTILLALGFGLGIATYGVLYRDLLKISTYAFQLLLFASPIFYPLEQVPQTLRPYYILNPLVGLLYGFRNILAEGKMPDLTLLLYGLPSILLIFIVGWYFFRQISPYYGDFL